MRIEENVAKISAIEVISNANIGIFPLLEHCIVYIVQIIIFLLGILIL